MCREAFGVFYALEKRPQAPEQEQSGAENCLLERLSVKKRAGGKVKSEICWNKRARDKEARRVVRNTTSVGVFLKEKHFIDSFGDELV
jgi:hypothetical protein